jgi:glucose-6-phosphate 1-epimerase
MQTLTELNEKFAIPRVLAFEEGRGGLVCAQVTSESCRAVVYLHGAHVAHWHPVGEKPVLFLSGASMFEREKPIRGGVPVIFPWFGPRAGERTDGPMHGFARLQVWDVAFAAVSDGAVHLTLTLGPTEMSRGLGFDHFRVALEVVMGRELTMRMSVANEGDAPLKFDEALHTYFSVGDATQVKVRGQDGWVQAQAAAGEGVDVQGDVGSSVPGYRGDGDDRRSVAEEEDCGGEEGVEDDGGVEPVGAGGEEYGGLWG